jgi:low affinity Fe/Cu permease
MDFFLTAIAAFSGFILGIGVMWMLVRAWISDHVQEHHHG